jgi:ribosomal protein L11 methyltransferase
MAEHIRPDGYAILSGILVEQADEVADVYSRNGFNVISREAIVDWITLTLRRKP